MASTLDGTAGASPDLHKGHGTAALGPSDSSDSGSDIQDGPGAEDEPGIFVPTGSTSDPDRGATTSAGADIGDADLDSDSDRNGTGERGAVGHDASVAVDTVLRDVRDARSSIESVDGAADSDTDPAVD
ncbi:MAG: hypothetical protein ABI440_01125 [Casimicrobiaceae bacterium]